MKQPLLRSVLPDGAVILLVVLHDDRCAILRNGEMIHQAGGDAEGIDGAVQRFMLMTQSNGAFGDGGGGGGSSSSGGASRGGGSAHAGHAGATNASADGVAGGAPSDLTHPSRSRALDSADPASPPSSQPMPPPPPSAMITGPAAVPSSST